jgi:SAM-dependent methyltransferase
VRDGTVFYLQDVSDGKLLAPENTLDFVTVALCVRDVGGVASRAVPLVGAVRFGDFRRPTPISYEWGFDRGQPIDRYYIENFLSAQAGDIQGHVLEFGNDSYTRRFGCDKVMTRDVLNYPYRTEETTFLTDLVSAPEIPSEIFDCVICTQTLQLVWDTRAAIRTLHRVLKPGGVLLATFPGLSQTYDTNWGERWYWNFTSVSARELFGEVFGGEHTVVDVHGNVLAAISFLHGLSAAELTVSELEARVPGYEVTISVRAVKAKGSEGE